MAKLTTVELKTLWNSGAVTNAAGNYLSFEQMISEYKKGNTITVSDGDNVTKIHPPMPRWIIGVVLTAAPFGLYLLDNAFRVAGY